MSFATMEVGGLVWHYASHETVRALGLDRAIMLACTLGVAMCVVGLLIVYEERKRRAPQPIEDKKDR